MADSVRGDGICRADQALAALSRAPELLERSRRRFSRSPPRYRSPSLPSTQLESPTPPGDVRKEQDVSEQRLQLRSEHSQSRPHTQFRNEVLDEDNRISEARSRGMLRVPAGTIFSKLASDNVKKRWLESGVWREEWDNDQRGVWRWRHEDQPEPEPQTEMETEAEHAKRVDWLFPAGAPKPPRQRRLKSGEERQRIEEQQRAQDREFGVSRPFFRFVSEVSREREWMQTLTRWEAVEAALQDPEIPELDVRDPPDINTCAYLIVKNRWVERKVWDHSWGVLPGMSWKHERPLEDFIREEMGDGYAPPSDMEKRHWERPGGEKRYQQELRPPLFPHNIHDRHEVAAVDLAKPSVPQPRLFGDHANADLGHDQEMADAQVPPAAELPNGTGSHASPPPQRKATPRRSKRLESKSKLNRAGAMSPQPSDAAKPRGVVKKERPRRTRRNAR